MGGRGGRTGPGQLGVQATSCATPRDSPPTPSLTVVGLLPADAARAAPRCSRSIGVWPSRQRPPTYVRCGKQLGPLRDTLVRVLLPLCSPSHTRLSRPITDQRCYPLQVGESSLGRAEFTCAHPPVASRSIQRLTEKGGATAGIRAVATHTHPPPPLPRPPPLSVFARMPTTTTSPRRWCCLSPTKARVEWWRPGGRGGCRCMSSHTTLHDGPAGRR